MKKPLLLLLIVICLGNYAHAQTIKVQPYLQDASPHSIYIMWETTSGEEATVEWGLTPDFGNLSMGDSNASSGGAFIHEVGLDNLNAFTTYYYRVKTGTAFSETYSFKTPPHSADHEDFHIIAMSDMQRDWQNPNKFQEVIEEGVIDFLEEEYGEDIHEHLAMLLIPGDLVVTGTNYGQWENDFFEPAQELLPYVPVYPVLGNHEYNSTYYFQYFKLPENGSEGYEEHWWHKDYGNVRIIGLDSNDPFSNQTQLDWLAEVLDNTCESDSIDFVFAELHHPHKSELWTPGESDYTGEVIAQLEQFSTDCGKPSIHFFGHTHGYSRGDSRDHKHLWINAASAGGSVDYWGEFPNMDYDEFSVSQDEYGFVSVSVTADEDPKLVIKRISRGNLNSPRDNEVRDSLVLHKNDKIVNTPTPVFPINEEVMPECVLLSASDYTAPDAERLHGQSHWQVATDANGFDEPQIERWHHYQNWYNNEDTQADDVLTDEKVMGLNENTNYWWRVRYRDRSFNWSAWSEPAAFSTLASNNTPNLLLNNGAEENSLDPWQILEGVAEIVTDGECDGISPHTGSQYFAVGGICEHSEVGRAFQEVDVSDYADDIDQGIYSANFGGYLSNYSGSDLPEIKIEFLDTDGNVLGNSNTLSSLNNTWTQVSEWVSIPSLTRAIQMHLKGTRNAGTDNDSYFDDLHLVLGVETPECDAFTDYISSPSANQLSLKLVPNPMTNQSEIEIPYMDTDHLKLYITNSVGDKVDCPIQYEYNRIILQKGSLSTGTYLFWLKNKNQVIGKGKFVVN